MIAILEVTLIGVLLVTAGLVAALRDPVEATVVFAAFSLGMAIVWIVLAAPDVALTEAAVGAGVVVILLLITSQKTGREQVEPGAERRDSFRPLNRRALGVVLAVALALGATTRSLPRVGDPDAPAVSRTDPAGTATPYAHYVGETAAAYDLPNAVATVLLIFRGLDTFGEIVVAFTAVVGILVVLDRGSMTARSEDERAPIALPAAAVMSPVGRTAVRLVVPLVFVFGVYLTLSGTVLPGGGFQGGVVMGASLILMALVFGHVPAGDWIDERALMAALVGGLLLFLAAVLGTAAFGGAPFEVAAYPLPPIHIAEVLEVTIGILVGGVITALVFAMAVGLLTRSGGGARG